MDEAVIAKRFVLLVMFLHVVTLMSVQAGKLRLDMLSLGENESKSRTLYSLRASSKTCLVLHYTYIWHTR